MSIVRIGLAETKHFSEGYAAIFGGAKKKKDGQEKVAEPKTEAKKKPAKTAKKKDKK